MKQPGPHLVSDMFLDNFGEFLMILVNNFDEFLERSVLEC